MAPELGSADFERGSKKSSFLASIFASILGSSLGFILDQKSHIFRLSFNMNFKLRFLCNHASFLLFLGALDIPTQRFYYRKTAIFKDLHVLAKLLELSQILSIFIDFWCQFYRIYACFWALDSCIIFSVIFGQFLDPGSIAQMSQN